jgi:HAD superfamily hydrolase (TIGR01509 family)
MAIANDLVIFDCDGVLVDSEVLSVEAMAQVLRAAGVPASEGMIARCFGMKQADILMRIATETGVDIPPEVPERLWPATRALFERSLKPMPGVEGFLMQLGDHKRCVASSSSPERIRVSLKLAGLDRFFGDDIFSSHQVARGKPAPDLFLFAAASMGIEPQRCVVIEDSIFGVEGARAAGMTAYGFGGGSHIQPGHEDTLLAGGAVAVEKSFDAISRRILA